jgi:polyvinyl alcohol dehydrogenase (cytochrome)
MGRYSLLLLLACSVGATAQTDSRINAARIFIEHCAVCHRANGESRAPQPEVLRQLPRETILQALETGVMKSQGAQLSSDERKAVAAYLSRRAAPAPEISTGFCMSSPATSPSAAEWNGWGPGINNTRFQAAEAAGLDAAKVPKLKLKWAFGFPGGTTSAQPALAGGRLLVGGPKGLYALDAQAGCIRWIFKNSASVRAAVSISRDGRTAYFADTNADAYALDAESGRLIWKSHLDPDPIARITGAPLLVDDRLYIPVSSGEEGAAINPYYECCKFRGSLVALDAATGKQIWKSYAIDKPAQPTGKNSRGTPTWGPSGAPIWSAPTADTKRNLVYVATGNNYSDPPDSRSDAILAFSMSDGHIVWSRQMIAGDRWNLACLVRIDLANCPPKAGDDYDFGAAPILTSTPEGRHLLLASQKSGDVYALDPDKKGEIVWQQKVAKGGPLGGIEWGGAVGDGRAYFPISDWEKSVPNVGGGLVALQVDSGKQVWRAPAIPPDCTKTPGCSAAQIAPATLIPGVVFSGSMDGHLRAYAAGDGRVLWDFNTAQPFKTTDGIEARGGSLNASGAIVADGMLFVTSGQSQGMPGNLLLAFSADAK